MRLLITSVFLPDVKVAIILESLDEGEKMGGNRDSLETQGYRVNSVEAISVEFISSFYKVTYRKDNMEHVLLGNDTIKVEGLHVNEYT